MDTLHFALRLSQLNTLNTHDWSIDKPLKADCDKGLNCMIDFVKVQPHLYVLKFGYNWGPFFPL